MTLEQALEIIQDYLPDNDLVLTIQFNTDDQWIDGGITPTGDPVNDLSSVSGDGFLRDAIIAIAKNLDTEDE
jgi:hypothetical protein